MKNLLQYLHRGHIAPYFTAAGGYNFSNSFLKSLNAHWFSGPQLSSIKLNIMQRNRVKSFLLGCVSLLTVHQKFSINVEASAAETILLTASEPLC